jgi:predicted exporter
MAIVGKPVLIDQMNAELGARIVALISADTERAQKRKAQRRAQKEAQRKARADAAQTSRAEKNGADTVSGAAATPSSEG